MKKIYEEEGKPYTSSLNFCPEARKGRVWAEKHIPPHHHTISQLIHGYFI
jgi:hypothetical protein